MRYDVVDVDMRKLLTELRKNGYHSFLVSDDTISINVENLKEAFKVDAIIEKVKNGVGD